MISKELLSEVLGIGVYQSIRKDEYAYNDIKLNIINTELLYDYVNIYELAHKCKEWALENGYVINSGATTSNDWCSTIYKVIKENPYIKELSHTWEQTEVESIFKACQWILDNKGNK